MVNVPSNGLWENLKKTAAPLFNHPDKDIQVFLSLVAIVVMLLLAHLIQRVMMRKMPPATHQTWVTRALLPAILAPSLVIMGLVAANSVAVLFVPGRQYIIAGFIKIAMVWFCARVLLFLTERHFIGYFISCVILGLTLLSVTNLLAPTRIFLNEINFETSTFHLSLLGIIKGIFTCVVLFWGASVLSKTGVNWLRRMHLSFNARELAIKFLYIGLYFLAGVLTLNEMGVDLTALTVFGGAFAVGLGFGLQKITSNFISGIILLFERTIETGDLIEVGQEKGWVRQMAIRHTLIETPDGREMLIPNEDLIIGKVTNWTYTNTRARIEVMLTVSYKTDIEQAQGFMLAAAKTHPSCLASPPPACFLKEFNDRGIQLQLVFWIADIHDGMSSVRSDVMLRIVKAFRESAIRFAAAAPENAG